MDTAYLAMRVVFAANVVVAGIVGALSLFLPNVAERTVFSGTATASVAMQVVGAFWLAIALLSVAGLFRPVIFAPVLLAQLLYKGSWLMVVAAPAYMAGRGNEMPGGITAFFLVWVLVLPFVIPWSALFKGA